MDTRNECHRKDCQGELWNRPRQEEGKEKEKGKRPPITWIEEIQTALSVY